MDTFIHNANATDVARAAPSQSLLSSNLSYCVVIAALLAAAIFMRSGTSQPSRVDAPFYNASRMKWMFSADKMVMDSYTKVSNRATAPGERRQRDRGADFCSFATECIRSKPQREYEL
jgi:hypothetical protein